MALPRPPAFRVIAISTGTFVRGLLLVGLAAAWLRLWPWVLVALIGVSLAIAIDPAVTWLARHRIRRGIAAPLIVAGGAVVVAAFFAAAAASLREDAELLHTRIDAFYLEMMRELPDAIQRAVTASLPTSESFAAAGQALFRGLGGVLVALALAIYFLLDGRRTYQWVVAFAPARLRPKVHETADGASAAIAAYMRGNLATSVIAGVATWTVLQLLHVPAALLLAVLAFFCDFVPVVGFVLSAGPAVLLAFTVSPAVALGVFGYFVAYHLIENYYIGPKVYGDALRLSDVAVIAAFLVGGELGGVLGALVALPIAATYPVVERVWLRDTERRDLPRDHQQIESQPEH
jgi:predicted PurR-regulated permease PerM